MQRKISPRTNAERQDTGIIIFLVLIEGSHFGNKMLRHAIAIVPMTISSPKGTPGLLSMFNYRLSLNG
jgi:hypothetical protein